MKTIMYFEELNRSDSKKVGGKGANLGEMVQAGMSVPYGFVVSAEAYGRHIIESGLENSIMSHINTVTADDFSTAEKASKEIVEAILSMPIPAEIAQDITKAYERLSRKVSHENSDAPVAVRSSANAEDLPGASFAGQQETYLNISGNENVLMSVQRCWSSLWSPRAISYRKRMGYEHLTVNLAVVVQAMIPAQFAGVMFTANPITGSKEELLITANYGLGESVVSGLATLDTFIVSVEGALLSKQLGTKEIRIVAVEKGTKEEKTPDNERNKYCLGDAELHKLTDLARKVTEHYRTPQDIEWAIYQGQLFLLQSRPITALPPNSAAEPKFSGLNHKELAFRRMLIQQLSEHIPDPIKSSDFPMIIIVIQAFMTLSDKLGIRTKPVTAAEINKRLTLEVNRPSFCISALWKVPSKIRAFYREDPGENWEHIHNKWHDYIGHAWKYDLDSADSEALLKLYSCVLESIEKYMLPRFEKVVLPGLIHEVIVKLDTVHFAFGK